MKALRRLYSTIVGRKIHSPVVSEPFVFLGSEYGGWPLIPYDIDSSSVIWSFGLGTDISFDLAAIERFGCKVVGFDPTPKSTAWLAQQELPQNFTYHEIGIAALDGEAEFYLPANKAFSSFSARPGTGQAEAIKAPVRRLRSLLHELKLASPDVIKMDIEGFEYEVIDDILSTSIRPRQLLIEFHHTMYGIEKSRTLDAVARLKAAGYALFYVSDVGLEYGFRFAG